ncbi:hypothetical protein CEXT_80291, partial [Caerostris extrusa]
SIGDLLMGVPHVLNIPVFHGSALRQNSIFSEAVVMFRSTPLSTLRAL